MSVSIAYMSLWMPAATITGGVLIVLGLVLLVAPDMNNDAGLEIKDDSQGFLTSVASMLSVLGKWWVKTGIITLGFLIAATGITAENHAAQEIRKSVASSAQVTNLSLSNQSAISPSYVCRKGNETSLSGATWQRNGVNHVGIMYSRPSQDGKGCTYHLKEVEAQ